jgi:hypothetical protein
MKNARRKKKPSVTPRRDDKSIAQRYVELLRLRDLVQRVEQKSASARR